MYPAPMIPRLILSIYQPRHSSDFPERSLHVQHPESCRVRLARQLLRIPLPVFGSEYFHTGNAVIAYASQRRDYILERKNAESRQEPVAVFELLARAILSVVDVKDKEPFGVKLFDG